MRRFTLLLFSLMTFASAAFAQKKMQEPVKWSTKVAKVDEEIELPNEKQSEYVLSFRANLEDHWHIYAQEQESDDGPLPTVISFEESDDYELVGEAEEIGELEVVYEEVFEMNVRQYSDNLIFAQKVRLLEPSTSFKVTIEYMVCSDESGQCIPFDKTFNVTLDKKKMTITQ